MKPDYNETWRENKPAYNTKFLLSVNYINSSYCENSSNMKR